MKMLSSPTCWRISIFAPSSVPIVNAPFSASFMLPVPEASVPAVEICSRQIGAGHHHLGDRDAVVRDEDDLQLVADARIVVDHRADIVDQPDDRLRHLVARCRLAGEDHRAWHPRSAVDAVRMDQHRLVAGHDVQHVEQLALVFVDPLDLHVEQARRIDAHAGRCARSMPPAASLLARLTAMNAVCNAASSRSSFSADRSSSSLRQPVPIDSSSSARQPRIGLLPASAAASRRWSCW